MAQFHLENYEVARNPGGEIALLFDLRDLPAGIELGKVKELWVHREDLRAEFAAVGGAAPVQVVFDALPEQLRQMLVQQHAVVVCGLFPDEMKFAHEAYIKVAGTDAF